MRDLESECTSRTARTSPAQLGIGVLLSYSVESVRIGFIHVLLLRELVYCHILLETRPIASSTKQAFSERVSRHPQPRNQHVSDIGTYQHPHPASHTPFLGTSTKTRQQSTFSCGIHCHWRRSSSSFRTSCYRVETRKRPGTSKCTQETLCAAVLSFVTWIEGLGRLAQGRHAGSFRLKAKIHLGVGYQTAWRMSRINLDQDIWEPPLYRTKLSPGS